MTALGWRKRRRINMSKEREALKLALEALNHYEKAGLATVKTIDAITAIKEALAQPEQYITDAMKVRQAVAQALLDDVYAEELEKPEAKLEQEPVEVWRDDAPPKRGVYRVKRGAQRGFSYWNGERWGMLCSSRPYAVEIRDMGRKTPSKYPMYWLHKTAHGVKE